MLSPSQIEAFETDGFIVIQDVLTPEQLAEARRGVEALVEQSRRLTQSDEIFDLDVGHSAEKPMIARIKNAGTHVPYPKEQGNLFVIQRSQKERYFK
jgi:7,8-dihydro-6-hydroxymethylpterin-pyrophosphokinase